MKDCCIICGVELDRSFDLCETCSQFLSTKYKEDAKKQIGRFKQTKVLLDKWKSKSNKRRCL